MFGQITGTDLGQEDKSLLGVGVQLNAEGVALLQVLQGVVHHGVETLVTVVGLHPAHRGAHRCVLTHPERVQVWT